MKQSRNPPKYTSEAQTNSKYFVCRSKVNQIRRICLPNWFKSSYIEWNLTHLTYVLLKLIPTSQNNVQKSAALQVTTPWSTCYSTPVYREKWWDFYSSLFFYALDLLSDMLVLCTFSTYINSTDGYKYVLSNLCYLVQIYPTPLSFLLKSYIVIILTCHSPNTPECRTRRPLPKPWRGSCKSFYNTQMSFLSWILVCYLVIHVQHVTCNL